nr:hypothetical protein [Pseudonocardiales bacterium]
RWAAGTTLRAAVHDTDGPVGAQLLQRLDFVASRSPVTRAQHDVSPLAVVRWGVPILVGSGGRRRRPDDAADSERPAAHQTAAHQTETEVDDDGPEEREEDLGPAISYWDHESARRPVAPHLETSASDVPGRHWGSPWGPETSQSETRPARAGEMVGAAALLASSPEPESLAELLPVAEFPPPPQPADPVAAAPADSEFSVEGLGIADLLAGALAAYRGI